MKYKFPSYLFLIFSFLFFLSSPLFAQSDPELKITKNLTIRGALTVSSNLLAHGNIGVGDDQPDYAVEIVGDLSASENITATSAIFAGAGSGGKIIFDNGETIDNETNGKITITGDALVTGDTELQGTLTVSNDVTASRALFGNGKLILTETVFSPVAGNNNDIDIGDATFVWMDYTTAGAVYTITGIAGGQPGRVIWLHSASTSAAADWMTVAHENGASAAANRIIYKGEGDKEFKDHETVELFYSGQENRWVIMQKG